MKTIKLLIFCILFAGLAVTNSNAESATTVEYYDGGWVAGNLTIECNTVDHGRIVVSVHDEVAQLNVDGTTVTPAHVTYGPDRLIVMTEDGDQGTGLLVDFANRQITRRDYMLNAQRAERNFESLTCEDTN